MSREWVADVVRAEELAGYCVFIGGSIARGWSNPGSDVDAYVLGAPRDATVVVKATGDRPMVDIHAISDDKLEKLFDKVSWDVAKGGDFIDSVPIREWLLLERIAHALVVTGEPRLREVQERLDRSAHRFMTIQEHFTYADSFAEDCLGQLAVGDVDSAVISAQESFLRTVDGLLAGRRCFSRNPKWRARALRDAKPVELDYERYWEVQTMADLPALGARRWVHRTVTDTRAVMAEVDLYA
ncbi:MULTISPECIES: hypothetical protein [Saccharothrix]|uniref:hypothetical protein n=1 Tax=Saccharothrix TaxID=2071 RepID=UPI00093C624B|nr:hypothetical protein [Saccharothrix sp. CB00851]OKI15389.1 hypothetical protein A6A25_13795 [Saccharothrix sp. CB00851]